MISQSEIAEIMQDVISTILIASAPILLTALVIGLVISIFQATTSIHEQTLSFVPKIIGVFVVLLLGGGFMLSKISDMIDRIFAFINTHL